MTEPSDILTLSLNSSPIDISPEFSVSKRSFSAEVKGDNMMLAELYKTATTMAYYRRSSSRRHKRSVIETNNQYITS